MALNAQLDPGEPNTDNLYTQDPKVIAKRKIKSMPPTLLHAVDNLVKDDVLRAALGKVPGGDYIDYYAETKQREFMDWHAAVTASEVDGISPSSDHPLSGLNGCLPLPHGPAPPL